MNIFLCTKRHLIIVIVVLGGLCVQSSNRALKDWERPAVFAMRHLATAFCISWSPVTVTEPCHRDGPVTGSLGPSRTAKAYRDRQASFIKPLLAEQQRHVSCVGAGRNWTHAFRVGVTGHRLRLSPTTVTPCCTKATNTNTATPEGPWSQPS